MRRGHSGIGGWRNENTRHFRPRSGGQMHYRPPRTFGLLDTPRFAPPGSRFKEIPPFNTRPETNYHTSEHHDRNKFRIKNLPNHQRLERDHHGHRGNYPHIPRRHGDRTNYSQYQETRSFHEDVQLEPYLVNSMGDVDHRQLMTTPKPREPFRHHRVPDWYNENKRSYYDEEKQNKYNNRPDLAESGKLPTSDYIGHRPPSSDHYGGNPGSAIDNSNSFSRSVDDTVDLVRKRLLNRNEPQHHSGNEPIDQNQEHHEIGDHDSSYQNTREAPTKKRVQRQKQNVKNNCYKIKNKIVHQLFKMDKDKIHKLMDNPSSSTKFEYAISSLITESQNSLNRHLRSVAEKSLTTSSDFINNDNNTIYEDTFMKQMQCILDPQDSVFLEDIKPLVMQELRKVLQLDNYEPQQENTEDQNAYLATDDMMYDHADNFDIYDEYPYEEHHPQNYELQNPEISPEKDYPEPLFERRPTGDRGQRSKSQERRFSMEQRRLSRLSAEQRSTENMYSASDISDRDKHRRSVDRKSHDEPVLCEPLPIFDSNAEHFSEEEDPFADLDKQYHVAVDHNFIQDYNVSPQQSITSNRSKSPPKNEIETPVKTSMDIKTEIDAQLFNIAKSPLEIIPSVNEIYKGTPKKDIQMKHECNITPVKKTDNDTPIKKEFITPVKNHNEDTILDSHIKQAKSSQEKKLDHRVGNSENNSNLMKRSSSGSSRKRSLDQRPSHRKEKRKKSESSQSEPSKQILNKNIIINVNDCASKKNEKCSEAAAKSIFNLFFSKGEHSKEPAKDTNKTESADKSYSDKYVKRKEQSIVSKDVKQGEAKKRHRSVSSSHSNVSPKGNSTSSNSSSNLPQIKSDSNKNKLKHIDMFTEQTRKVSLHQSNRNTALPPMTPEKVIEENKANIPTIKVKKTVFPSTKLISKETQTFESKKCISRFIQTERKKLSVKAIQTDPVTFEKSGSKSTDTFERMKEIDLEIQVLLQEKFKLYSSLETKDPNQTLGMTVLNVVPFEEDKEQGSLTESEDAIVADFTSIPVEELEQIALETVDDDDAFETRKSKKSQRQKVLERERTTSRSPSKSSKKGKGPNISLIEQIITDDRPLEDIISLDDLECSPVKSKRKLSKQTKPKKKTSNKKRSKQTKAMYNTIKHGYNLKECCVILHRDDIENYYQNKREQSDLVFTKLPDEPAVIVETIPVFADTEIESMYSVPEREETIQETIVNDDSVNVNDIHFDMLDVSEDIVIGDVYDVKSNDKDVGGRMDMSVSEEIILDNSQSSEDVAQAEAAQPDSQCKMYDFSTDENLRRDAHMVTSNPDAVLALECVENNNFLAACLDGNVYHYSSDGQLITTLRGYNQPVTCLNIVRDKYGTTVYTGSLDSRIRYYDLESGMEKGPECNVLSPIQSMDRAWDTVFVGTRTGFVLQFECKNNMLIPVSTVKFSEQSILALRAMKEGPRKVLLVAARAEDVTVRDAQTGLLLRTLSGPKMTVYSLLYEDGKVYCGTSSHQIHVFDYASSSHVATHSGGKGVVCLRASGGLLFAGCYDGCVYVYREGEPRPLAQLRGPGVMLLSLAIVGSKIIAGYKDRGLHIWKIPLGILQEMIL
ncbi:uncharacterized protein LOC128677069 [Plodia interpunctella]|uniref:uncharacterized protein LOC128677069 n=1 Tax=Plodia interpunctella TaxID=58824 RepID=UPI002367AADB|nr:uncharacterized protein LOC128677069 [Plodia interpunctella]